MSLFKTQRGLLGLLLILMPLLLPACGLFNSEYQRNNQVRLAVYQYERAERGLTDDLVIHYVRSEPRVKFPGQNNQGGRTVWLFEMGAPEYFDLLPPGRTYLYIQDIQYNQDNSQATVDVYRGDSSGYTGHRLTLARQPNGQWQVVDDLTLAEN